MVDPQETAAIKPAVSGSNSDHGNRPERRLQPIEVRTSSPRFPLSPSPPLSSTRRRIGIAVDLSDESAYAVKWAVDNYLRPGDAVVLLHVNSTAVLFGADWGSSPTTIKNNSEFQNFTATKANQMAQPLADAAVPFKIHIVKDHDMQERLCLEIERQGLNAVIIGSRGIGGSRVRGKGRLGSVSDYCVQHCVCPVVVVRYNREETAAEEEEEMQEFHDANDFQHK